MRYITAQEGVVIPLGRQGENEVTTIKFDVSGWAEEYGDGAFELLHERCMDSAPYACPISVDTANEVIEWVVRNSDTAYKGRGTAQLVYIVNASVAKSVLYYTSTLASIDADMEFPDPYEDWLVQMHEDAEYVREHYEGALEAQENAEAWAVGQRSGEDVSEDDATYHNNSKWYSALAAENGEAWAVGQRNGVDVESSAAEYHNNSKWYAQQSAASAQESYDSADLSRQYMLQASGFVGAPLTATTKSAMTDTTRVYVYVGSESGMTSGHWYYHNGTAWADGGVYNSVADDIATTTDIDNLLYS